jgi:predicted metalloenzyme YecM
MKAALAEHGRLLGEHPIGGRPIASYRMDTPFRYAARSIQVLELPAPKAGSPYPEGFEHAEFVVNERPELFADRYPQLAWDRSAAHKTTNADVRLNYEGFSVKFHQRSLADLIAEETGA